MSAQYIPQRFLPDKAIDLVDEAAASIKIEAEKMPTSLDELKRKITSLEIELASLKKDQSDKAKQRRKTGERELTDLKDQAEKIEKQWKEQKEIIQRIQAGRAKIDAARIELEKAEREVDLQKAAELTYGNYPTIGKNH